MRALEGCCEESIYPLIENVHSTTLQCRQSVLRDNNITPILISGISPNLSYGYRRQTVPQIDSLVSWNLGGGCRKVLLRLR